jgi:ABC-type multidrug transport system ATPase subunit
MEQILLLRNVAKRFGKIEAVKNVNLSVYRGDIYGFLGPNGSGKSTTIRMLLGLISPDQGEIQLFGNPLTKKRNQILSKIGALIERPDFYNYLSAYQNLELLAAYSGLKPEKKRIFNLLEMVDLHQRYDSKVRTFSQGMKQRLGIAQALLHDPDLIILDEPVNGLDPQGIKDIRNLILRLNRDFNKTLIVSSHILREMELISNRMIVISKGEVVVEGDVQTLLSQGKQQLVIVASPVEKALLLLRKLYPESNFTTNNLNEIEVPMNHSEIPAINKVLVENEVLVYQLNARNSLEDYFLQHT